MASVSEIKTLLDASRSDEAIAAADVLLQSGGVASDTMAMAYYLRGNAYRQQGNWRMAINSYLEAIELDPDGPAVMAYNNAQEILAFFNKDLYNP
ncbi:MAG: tetratricopeptide repeat protein [Bacteroidales bacterium]|nr:tetratricopeptide repeat protein [Candidatus Sodaliphilus fimicaballi]